MQESSQERYGITVAKKAERLVTALYLVTDLIDGSEPIKNGLRKNSVVLLSSMNALAQPEIKDKLSEFSSSLKATMEIISLLHVAGSTGLISDMNTALLIEGFRVLQLVLEKKQPLITKEMLAVDKEETLYNNDHSYNGINSTSYDVLTPRTLLHMHESKEREIRDTNKQTENGRRETVVSVRDKEAKISLKGQRSAPDDTLREDLLLHVSEKGRGFSSSFQTKKQGRREQIRALFVKGVDVSIKDIAAKIKGCSEKTIQRELNALVYDNVIERVGEKRWSRYVLR